MRNTLLILFVSLAFATSSCRENTILFVGGFTLGDDEKGLSVFEFDSREGTLELISENDVGPSPAYFCFSEKNNMVYVANAVMEFRGEFGGGLTAMKYFPESGRFEKKNEMLIPYAGPCYISMSADSGYLFIANYPNGSVVVVKLDDQGVPSTITDTILYVEREPDLSRAHMIIHDPAGKYVYVTDLGLNRLMIYDFSTETGKLHLLEHGIVPVPEGSGPRHFAFNTDGSKLYLINEHGSTIMTFAVEENGGLLALQTVGTKKDESIVNNYCADIHIGKDGKYLYGSNRGENSIVVYNIGEDGLLTLGGHSGSGGDWPRNFIIDPSGKYLLAGNQKSDQIAVFRINRKTGLPEGPLSQTAMKMPACLKFSPFKPVK